MLIGEVSTRSGVSTRMLRHYDAQGLVVPTGRTAGGYREYSVQDVQRLLRVEGLRSLGLSLKEIRRVLDDPGHEPGSLIRDLIAQTRERIARERELLRRLEGVEHADPGDWETALQTVRLLRDLGSERATTRQRAALGTAGRPLAAEALAEAALAETEPNVAGTLRWALARHDGGDVASALTAGLAATDVDTRRRAVAAIAELRAGDTTGPLRGALRDTDAVVRARAALALGARGDVDAVPTLVEMVVAGVNDVEAADLLRDLAHGAAAADDITAALVGRLEVDPGEPGARSRLTQALVELPGEAAHRALVRLAGDADPAVALTARASLAGRDRPPSPPS